MLVVVQPLSRSANSLWPHGLQHARFPCPSLSPGVCSNSCPLSRWRHPIISSSVVPLSSCLRSVPESGSFPMSQLFKSNGQSIGASALASVLPMNIQGWYPLGLTGFISLLSKRLSRVILINVSYKDYYEHKKLQVWASRDFSFQQRVSRIFYLKSWKMAFDKELGSRVW